MKKIAGWNQMIEKDFQRQKNQRGQIVEHVHQNARGETSSEFVPIAQLTERDQRVGDRRADIRS